MAKGSPSGVENQDNSLVLMFLVLGLLFALIIFGEKPFIYMALYSVKLKILLLNTLGLASVTDIETLAKINARLTMGVVDDLNWSVGSSLLNGYFRLEATLFALLLFFLSFILFVIRPAERYVRKLNMKSLLFQKARVHPIMRPVYGLQDYLKKRSSFFNGPWRLAESPIQFSLRHGLIYELKTVIKERPVSKEKTGGKDEKSEPKVERVEEQVREYVKPDMKNPHFFDPDEHLNSLSPHAKNNWYLDKKRARQVFQCQLGIPMISKGMFVMNRIKSWPIQHRGLLAAFILIRYASREDGYKLLNQFSSSFWSGDPNEVKDPNFKIEQLNTQWVDEVLDHYVFGKPVSKDFPFKEVDARNRKMLLSEIKKHGFANTILFHMLDKVARSRGIVVTPEFIWLRPIDRTLYYALNNAGRNNPNNATGYAEGLGVVSHYMVEESYGGPLSEPDVQDAIYGIEEALYQHGWLIISDKSKKNEQEKAIKNRMNNRSSALSSKVGGTRK